MSCNDVTTTTGMVIGWCQSPRFYSTVRRSYVWDHVRKRLLRNAISREDCHWLIQSLDFCTWQDVIYGAYRADGAISLATKITMILTS